MDDNSNKPATEWPPIEGLPVFEADARDKAGKADEHLAVSLTVHELYRFVYGNCGYTRDDVQKIAAFVLANLPNWSNHPVWSVAAQIYFLGMMDGCRMSQAQNELDADRVQKGKVN